MEVERAGLRERRSGQHAGLFWSNMLLNCDHESCLISHLGHLRVLQKYTLPTAILLIGLPCRLIIKNITLSDTTDRQTYTWTTILFSLNLIKLIKSLTLH